MFRYSSPKRNFAMLSLCIILPCGWPLLAQQPPAPNLSKEQKELQDLQQYVADIGELKFLNPLKLTGEQIDKLTEIITTSQNEYNAQMAAFDHSGMKKISEDIREARKTALAGGTVPNEQNDRINKAIEAHLKSAKRQGIHDKTLGGLSQKMRTILTPEQIDLAAKMAKEETEKTRTAQGTNAQWFNAYVKSVIMSYPRIVPLLKEIRAAKEPSKES